MDAGIVLRRLVRQEDAVYGDIVVLLGESETNSSPFFVFWPSCMSCTSCRIAASSSVETAWFSSYSHFCLSHAARPREVSGVPDFFVTSPSPSSVPRKFP